MMFKTIVLLVQLYLTINCQEVDPEKPSFVTCEFDLVVNDYNVLESLPEECKEAYNDVNLRRQMLEESERFALFKTKLDDKENVEYEGVETLALDWELRNKTYTEAELHWCLDSENYDSYLSCLISKRNMMIDAIDAE